MSDPIVIVAARRTPMGGFLGELADVTAPNLGAVVISSVLAEVGIAGAEIDEVIMGCVLTAGQGQAPARQASLAAGLPPRTGATTINKMCGSGMKATMLAHDLLLAGSARSVVAGGMESMSNAPHLLPNLRGGYRIGNGRIADHMFLDGLEDAYDKGRLMGTFAEDCAQSYQLSREIQDGWAVTSLERAQGAIANGLFATEIAPVAVTLPRGGEKLIDTDEQPGKAQLGKIPLLKPAFRDGGTVTAANSSSISDGAAALIFMRASEAQRRGLTPRGVFVAHSTYAGEPASFPTAPVTAIRTVSQKAGWSLSEVDLFEVNEAFAVVTLAAMRELRLPPEKMNIHGGACALGHPIGASGARIMVTLLAALQHHDLRRGIASVCIGGGEATAVAIERLN